MDKLEYRDVIEHLFKTFPDVKPQFEQRTKELYGEGLPHVVYGDVLVEYLNSIADENERQKVSTVDKAIKEVFGFIEELSGSENYDIICLVKTGFIEGLMSRENGLKRFEKYMGPKTRNLIPV